jgi:hypothetical protein
MRRDLQEKIRVDFALISKDISRIPRHLGGSNCGVLDFSRPTQ